MFIGKHRISEMYTIFTRPPGNFIDNQVSSSNSKCDIQELIWIWTWMPQHFIILIKFHLNSSNTFGASLQDRRITVIQVESVCICEYFGLAILFFLLFYCHQHHLLTKSHTDLCWMWHHSNLTLGMSNNTVSIIQQLCLLLLWALH